MNLITEVARKPSPPLLSDRYRYGGDEVLELTDSQGSARDVVRAKLLRGDYALEEACCPACGGSNKRALSERDMYGLPMHVAFCENCDLVYTSPRMTEAALREFYETDYRALDRAIPGADDLFQLERRKGSRILELLESRGLTSRIGRKPVVEVGCGAGGVLAVFQEHGYKVVGCDLGEQYLIYGRDRHGLNLRVGGLDVLGDALGGQRAGLIIYEQVLEHLSHPLSELRHARSLMDDDALLYVGVPGLRNIDNHYASDFLRYLQLPHLLHFDLETLTNLMGLCGFRRIAGDEEVRAIFDCRTAEGGRSGVAPPNGNISDFLTGLEHRFRTRQRRLRYASRLARAVNLITRPAGRIISRLIAAPASCRR